MFFFSLIFCSFLFIGQQQLIKVMQPSNGKPLTQAGVKAIVKEVTGHDATRVLGQNINMGGSQVIHTSHRPTSLFIFKFFFWSF